MDKRIKAKWVKALRSGRYRQAKGRLRLTLKDSVQANCCLGVLCRTQCIPITPATRLDGDELLSESVLKHLGLANYQQHILSNMNDNGKSFAEIADYIEKNL